MSTKEEILNALIKGSNTNEISDGYHSFGELYRHRTELFLALCRTLKHLDIDNYIWRSTKDSFGQSIEGWFIMGIDYIQGKQITYHLPMNKWADCEFALTLDKAPLFDGHCSYDVELRLQELSRYRTNP